MKYVKRLFIVFVVNFCISIMHNNANETHQTTIRSNYLSIFTKLKLPKYFQPDICEQNCLKTSGRADGTLRYTESH